MAHYRKHEIVSGIFIVVAFLVFVLFAFRVGDLDLLGLFRGESILCRTYLTDVQTLEKGQPVKVGGLVVGKVKGIRMVERALTEMQARHLLEFYEDKAAQGLEAGMVRQLQEVTFELADPDLKLLPEVACVMLRQESPLAPYYLELDPGEWSADQHVASILTAGFEEPVTIHAREGTGFEELVAIVKPVIRRADDILARLQQGFLSPENARSVASTLTDMAATARTARRVAQDADQILQDLVDQGLSRKAGAVLEGAEKSSKSLHDAIRGLRADLDRLIAATEGLVSEARGTIADNRAEIAETVRRTRRAAWQAEMALRKIRANPAVVLWGDDETDFEAGNLDATWWRRTGRALPYEQRDENEEAAEAGEAAGGGP